MERNRRGRPRHPDVLTPAEWRVLDALREGGTNAEIAERLGLSLDTVKYHVSNMLAKLELGDRRALAAWRPEERRGRLGALFTVPAVVWTVARPIAWVGAGTAAVAGVVVGVVAVVALVAVVLVTAGCDTDPPLAVAPPPTQTSTPIPAATASPTAQPSPTPTGTPSPSPTPTPATPTPTPEPSPSPTSTPTPTPTATPTSMPVRTILPLPTLGELGIREVGHEEAASGWPAPTRYEAGDDVPWAYGVLLLDVESGVVEAWMEGSDVGPHDDSPSAVSPSSRFLIWPGRLYDREASRWFAWDEGRIRFDRAWGAGSDQRLLFHVVSSGDFVTMDVDLRPVMQFEIPLGERFTSPRGGYILVREPGRALHVDRFHIVNLRDEASPEIHSWTHSGVIRSRDGGHRLYDIQPLDELVAIVGATESEVCRVRRYSLRGALLSDVQIACQHPWRIELGGSSSPRLSPDGSAIVAEALWIPRSSDVILSVSDATTGEQILRIKGIWVGWNGASLNGGWSANTLADLWLADSSGIVVDTPRGPRIATLGGTWEWAPGRPSSVDADLFHAVFNELPAVMTGAGKVLASISFGPHAPVLGLHGACSNEARTDWGATADTVQIRPTPACAPEGPAIVLGAPGLPLAPIIELPPFDDDLRVEVVADTCANLRSEPSIDGSALTCLPDGTVVKGSGWGAARGRWMHIRTEDGVEGWAHADYLRWHSDGVRLEE